MPVTPMLAWDINIVLYVVKSLFLYLGTCPPPSHQGDDLCVQTNERVCLLVMAATGKLCLEPSGAPVDDKDDFMALAR